MTTVSDPSRIADVIVIGGGIIGCSIALRLAQARLRVLVLERAEPGSEASSAAAGMLAPQGEMIEHEAFFELCVASRDLYPSFVAELEELSGLGVGYRRDGTLLVAAEENHARELSAICQAQTRRGFNLQLLEPAEIHRQVPGLSPEIRSGLFVSGDHWVDNQQLMRALVESCGRLGVGFEAGRAVTKLNARSGRVESVEVSPGSMGAGSPHSAGSFILAAGCWSHELVAPLGMNLSLKPCRGQMTEFDAPAELPLVVRAGIHYLVPRAPQRIVVGTTAEYAGFEKAVTGEGLRSILEGAMRIAPLLRDCRFRRAWAGLRPDTMDHLPILGYGEVKNLIVATGHFRNGILLAPVTAQVISELLLTGSTSPPIEPYRPARFA